MCDQRERLIGYVYDECEPGDRAAVQQHLESCEECRQEIAALRSVRVDLQAWEVPDHESVWKPFAPAPAVSWWSQIPRWAMAAAASMVVASGAAGGAVSYALMRGDAVQAAPAGAVQIGPAVTVNEVNALEQRMQALVRTEVDRLNARVQLVSSRPIPADVEAALRQTFDGQLAELRTVHDQQVTELRAINDKQVDAINAIYNNLGQLKLSFDTRHGLLKTSVENLASVVQQGR